MESAKGTLAIFSDTVEKHTTKSNKKGVFANNSYFCEMMNAFCGYYGSEDYITNYLGGWTKYDWDNYTMWWWNKPRNGGRGLQTYETFSCVVSDLKWIFDYLGAPKKEEFIWDDSYKGYWLKCTWVDKTKMFWWGI